MSWLRRQPSRAGDRHNPVQISSSGGRKVVTCAQPECDDQGSFRFSARPPSELPFGAGLRDMTPSSAP